MGAVFTFRPSPTTITSILARVGVSFISAEQACQNADEEIPDFDFERLREEASVAWDDVLGRVQVDLSPVETGENVEQKAELFYSSVCSSFLCHFKAHKHDQLYRTHISPADCEPQTFACHARKCL